MLYLDASPIVRHAALLLVFGWCKTTSVSAQFREPPAAPVATKPAETKPVEIADEPRTIDPATLVPALLATPKTIAFKETALKEVVAWLQQELKTSVLVDRKALAEAKLLISEPITDELKNEPLYLLLDRLQILGLDWYLADGLLHLTSIEVAQERQVTVSYNLGDLLDAGYESEALLSAVAGVCGEEGDLTLLGDVLFARENVRIHRKIAGLFAALRKPARRTFIADAPQHAPLRAKLELPITIDFQETALETAVQQLAGLAEIDLRLNRPALAARGISLRKPITLSLTDQKLRTVLQAFLSQEKLDWALADGVLWISPQHQGEEDIQQQKAAVFDVRDLCVDHAESDALLEAILNQTNAHWEIEEGTGGNIIFARPGVMVVRAVERTLDDVLQLLENYRIALRGSKPRPQPGVDPKEVLTRYYRLPLQMAIDVEQLLPEQVRTDTWKTAERPEAIGTIRRVISRPEVLASQTAPAAGSPAPPGVLIDYAVLMVRQTREAHQEISKLLWQLENGDSHLEMSDHMGGGMGGFGGGGVGFGGQQGGFGSGLQGSGK